MYKRQVLPFIFDIYISKKIPWGFWKKSENPAVRSIMSWVDAIVFALVAVYFVNIYVFQNYQIPSSSLEKSLLVGDFLYVSKMSYGPRVPNTPLSMPLAQHTLPVFNTKSYIEWPQWEYKRVPGFGKVKLNDIVVFNFPAGDTVATNFQQTDFYTLAYEEGKRPVPASAKRILLTGCPTGGVIQKVGSVIENNGGVIVSLDDCSGERTNRLLVDENAPDILRAISDRYLSINCSVMTSNNGRLENTAQMIRDYQVDGVVEIVLQACHTFNVEAFKMGRMAEEMGIP